MKTTRRISVLLVALGLLVAPAVRADEPSAADTETALQLFKDGKALREKGDDAGALEKLRAAHALVETPLTAYELGRTYEKMGKLVEAREILLGVARIPVRKNESQKATDARGEAERLAAELRPRLASVTVRPRGATTTPPKISVDGAVLPADAATVPRVVNPGAHVIELEANGQRSRAEVSLGEGEAREVEIDVPPPSAETAPPPAPVASAPGAERASVAPMQRSGTSPLVYAGFGTAIVGVSVGAITGIMTLSTAGTLKDTCRDGQCPPSSRSDLDSVSSTGTVSTVAFVIGLVGAAVGVAGLLMPPSEPARTGLRVVPGPGGIRGSF